MSNTFSNGNLFSPIIIQKALEGTGAVINASATDYSGSDVTGSNSYQFDDPGSALKSTQQLPIDWSKFEKHTFFNSAESKVNVAFDTIINYYPFDGSEKELQEFLNNLTGFEKHVFDNFPKQTGYLLFSGSKQGEDPSAGFPAGRGNWIQVDDVAGSLYPSLSRNNSGMNIIDPGLGSISFQFFINLPPEASTNQVVFQKKSDNNHGYSLFVSESGASRADMVFLASSGSSVMSASYNIPKNEFVHLSFNLDRDSGGLNKLNIFHTGTLVSTSSNSVSFGDLDFQPNPLYIGSGSSHNLGSLDSFSFIPETTLSASIDDFRCYHGSRTSRDIKSNFQLSAFANENLKMYFKFNEASGSYSNNSVVLDSSGNSLHSRINNYQASSRDLRMGPTPLLLESPDINPVLFPTNDSVKSYNANLLAVASQYDSNNPNLITNLIPKHYLLESSLAQGFSDEYGETGAPYGSNISFPGGGTIGQPQIISALLFSWAKFFDEVKLFIDHFGKVLSVDYEDKGGISDWMLPFLGKYYGFQLPNNFSNSSYSQYILGEDLNRDPSISEKSLFKVQTEIWRRILVNLNYIIRSKGTVEGVKAVMRAAGINPETMFRFREFGGSRTMTTQDARRKRSEIASQLWLSASESRISSPYLSGSRISPGFPFSSNTSSPARSDGLFTSGSWTYEGLYQFDFPFTSASPVTQSLVRMWTTGSTGDSAIGPGSLISNLVAYGTGSRSEMTGSLKLFLRPSSRDSDNSMALILTGVNIFDKDRWHISFGRDIGTSADSFATASYFVRASKSSNGEIVSFHQTSSFVNLGPKEFDVFSQASDDYNASGSYFEIGEKSGSPAISTAGNKFLNASSVITDEDSRETSLSAKLSGIRFWTKALNEKETKEHTRNFKSLGVENPQINFNFVTLASGSWERLRIDANIDQVVTKSNISGEISIFDFSQNNLSLSAEGFEPDKTVVHPARFDYSILDPSFGERSSENKVRIRGFDQDINIEEFNSLKSPVRMIQPGQPTLDDPRFSIEISSVGALNEDIVNLLAGLDWLDSAIGNPELQFASDYPDLRRLREVYFQRLTDKVNFENLFLFYKWFDDSLSVIIERLVPRTTKYLGINFVIESHFLERPKFRNMNNNIYLSASDRRDINNELLIAVLSGMLKRF